MEDQDLAKEAAAKTHVVSKIERTPGGLKIVTHPVTGKKVVMGRKRPKTNPPMLKLSQYLLATSATPPATISYEGSADTPTGLGNILGNDVLGDCTSAGALHIEDVFRANAGNGLPMLNYADAVKFYSMTTGYVPGDPSTDQGGDEITVLNFWKKHGLFGNGSAKLSAYLAVNGANKTELQTAIWYAENLYFGVELPDAWINPFPSANGFVWDVAGNSDPDNGHCFIGLGYNAQGVIIDSWGFIGTITWAAIAKYATAGEQGQVFTVVSPDQLNWKTGNVPVGFSYAQLVAHIEALS